MPATITIGEFSRLTHLPVKTLHHYHDVGVLVPAEVDPATGYRRYTPEQVTDAHLVRRLRDVRMPPAEIRAVLHAAPHEREAGIAAHLDRLHRRLTETATAVASLRALMAGPVPSPVRMRDVPAVAAVADSTVISREAIGDYSAEVYPRLFAEVGRSGLQPAGPGAALYGPGWFENDGGEVTAYVPVVGPTPKTSTIPGGRYAVALHIGSFEELDLTYGLLGRHVLDREGGSDGPIREIYLVGPGDTADPAHWRTEILWPL